MKATSHRLLSGLFGEVKKELANLYGARLRGVYLYGSYAREEAHAESDVDLLIVLDRLENYSDEIKRTSRLVSDLSLEYGISISRVFAAEADWLSDQRLFFLNLRDEAIQI